MIKNRPIIVCLCGSTRFGKEFEQANLQETLRGKIVLTIGCSMRSDAELFKDLTPEAIQRVKSDLDELHKRKIDLADEVLILNKDGYVGESTLGELIYARARYKCIRWLEPNLALSLEHTGRPRKSSQLEILKAQAHRGIWRAVFWAIKSRMEAVEFGIESFQEAFMSHFEIPGTDKTIGDVVLPQFESGKFRLLTDGRGKA